MRLFVAVEMAGGLKTALGRAIEHLSEVVSNVKWVGGDNFHLTLYFLGEVTSEQLPWVRQELDRAKKGVPCFDLELRGLGAFPNVRRPRVIWAGVNGGPALIELQRRVSAGLDKALGVTAAASPFKPHITLGRIRNPQEQPVLTRYLQENRNIVHGEQRVQSFHLIESKLFRSGPIYTSLDEYQLEQC